MRANIVFFGALYLNLKSAARSDQIEILFAILYGLTNLFM